MMDETSKLIELVLAVSTADHTTVTVSTSTTSNLRFARNMVTTSGDVSDHQVTVTVSFGTRSGTASVNQLDAASIREVVQAA